jgi:hypothetical protein
MAKKKWSREELRERRAEREASIRRFREHIARMRSEDEVRATEQTPRRRRLFGLR